MCYSGNLPEVNWTFFMWFNLLSMFHRSVCNTLSHRPLDVTENVKLEAEQLFQEETVLLLHSCESNFCI